MSNVTTPPQRSFRNKSFFETTLQELTENSSSLSLPLSDIYLPLSQPRKYFDADSLNCLAESIKKDGLLQPLIVRPLEDGKYELVAGERRYRAAQQINLESVPVLIKNLSPEEAQVIALTENLQREDLNPVEETEGILALLELKFKQKPPEIISLLNHWKDQEQGKVKSSGSSPHNVVGKKEIEDFFLPLGLTWQSFLTHRIPLLNLPDDILTVLRQGKIAYTKAKLIAKITEPEIRVSFLEEAIAQNYTLSQIKQKLNHLKKEIKGEEEQENPKETINTVYKKLKSSKVWEDSRKWKKIQGWLQKVEKILEE